MGVIVGTVPVFASTEADKAQAMKVVEEAAEVFGAWQTWVDGGWCAGDRRALIGECADVIQATCNLLDALGVVDMEQHIEECRARNEARGREYRGARTQARPSGCGESSTSTRQISEAALKRPGCSESIASTRNHA